MGDSFKRKVNALVPICKVPRLLAQILRRYRLSITLLTDISTLPLIIAALENYSGGLGATVAFFRWKGQLKAALQSLWLVSKILPMRVHDQGLMLAR
jgi:hypothetical protein